MSSADRAVSSRRDRQRRRRRAVASRWVVRLAIGALVFGVGIALGQALREGPEQQGSVTLVRTLTPGVLGEGTRTVTVTVTAPAPTG